MNIDDIDLKIISIMYHLDKQKDISTSSLAKQIFPNECETEYLLKTKTNFINARIKKLCTYGIMDMKKDGWMSVYYLLTDKCQVKKIKIKDKFLNFFLLIIENKAVLFEFQ